MSDKVVTALLGACLGFLAALLIIVIYNLATTEPVELSCYPLVTAEQDKRYIIVDYPLDANWHEVAKASGKCVYGVLSGGEFDKLAE